MLRHFLDDLSKHAAHGTYQIDILYDILVIGDI